MNTSTTALTLCQTRMFGESEMRVYKNDSTELYMTREQIGAALGYTPDPAHSILLIHSRHKDRLDPLSRGYQIETPSGTQRCIVYNLRGVMEICRLSRQPKADAFMDFTWDVMENLYRGESVLATKDQETALAPEAFQAKLDSIMETNRRLLKENSDIHNSLLYIKNQLKDKAAIDHGSEFSAKQIAFTKINQICRVDKAHFPDVKAVLRYLYAVMNRDYGFVDIQARKDYQNRHPGCSGYVSIMDTILDNGTWTEIFTNLLEDVYQTVVMPVPVKENVQEDTDVIEAIALPVHSVETKPRSRAKSNEKSLDRVQAIANPLAEKLGDASHHFNQTYHRIYSTMNCNWQMIRKGWKTRHGMVSLPTQKFILLENDALFRKFKAAAKQIEEEKK